MQDRVAEVLDEASRGPVHASEFTDERRQARAIAGLMLAWHLGFERAATAATGALMQDEMGDVHLDRRQLDHLMGVVRRQRDQLAMATGTRGGLDQVHLGRAEQGGAGAGVPLASASLP